MNSYNHTMFEIRGAFVSKIDHPLPHFLRNFIHTLLTSLAQQSRQRNRPRQCQPHVSPHPNRHARIVMAVQLVMLVRANSGGDVMKHCSSDNSSRIRQRTACFRRSGRWHRVGEADQDEGESNEAPAIVAHVVEFEIVGCEVGLGRWTEPTDHHDGVVNPAKAADAVPECCAIGVGVEDLENISLWLFVGV